MPFWVYLDAELVGDRGESGYAPRGAVEDLLDDWGIWMPSNRDAARKMLTAIASGRNAAMSEKIESEKSHG